LRHNRGHKRSLVRHALKRASERLDLFLTPKDLDELVREIAISEPILRQSLVKDAYRFCKWDREFIVIYHRTRKSIVTFFDLDLWDCIVKQMLDRGTVEEIEQDEEV